MLELLRRQSYLVYVIFGSVLVIFATNLGPGSRGCNRTPLQEGWAAQVNGEQVPYPYFAAAYARQIQYFKELAEQTGQPFDPNMLEQFGFTRHLLDQLVNQTLFAQAAASFGISLSDEDLAQVLRDSYSVDEVDFETYQSFVERTYNTNVAAFEERLRRNEAGKRLATALAASLMVPDAELVADFNLKQDALKAVFARFDLDLAGQSNPSAQAIAAVLKEDEQGVREHYERDASGYRRPHRVLARQIVKKVPADASAEIRAGAEKALHDLLQEGLKGADFGALAKAHSEDEATAPAGGELGFVERGALPPALEEAVFTLKEGQATDKPVRTEQGLHLVQVMKIELPEKRPFEEVAENAARDLLRLRAAHKQAKDSAQSLLTALQAGKSWESLTQGEDDFPMLSGLSQTRPQKTLPKRFETATLHRYDEEIPSLGNATGLLADLFALPKAPALIPKVITMGDAYFVVGLSERQQPDSQRFAAEKETLREKFLEEREREWMEDWGEHLRKRANVMLNTGLLSSAAVAP